MRYFPIWSLFRYYHAGSWNNTYILVESGILWRIRVKRQFLDALASPNCSSSSPTSSYLIYISIYLYNLHLSYNSSSGLQNCCFRFLIIRLPLLEQRVCVDMYTLKVSGTRCWPVDCLKKKTKIYPKKRKASDNDKLGTTTMIIWERNIHERQLE